MPASPQLGLNDPLSVVIGQLRDARRSVPVEHPSWLVIPDPGRFTGMAIFGAIGSGKTSCCMRCGSDSELPRDDPHRRIGGLVLEVKGDFCRQIRRLLQKAGRAEDYIEISLTGPYRYDPLHDDLDALTLAPVSSIIYSGTVLAAGLYDSG